MEIALENFPAELKVPEALAVTVKKVINAMETLYNLERAEVSVTLTDNAYIRTLNAQYRNKDAATDVLSFALNEGDEPEIQGGAAINLLGDIIISIERAEEQACEYGHSIEREVAFLTVHGMLHLLGYDHIEEADRQEMRQEEEYVLAHLSILR